MDLFMVQLADSNYMPNPFYLIFLINNSYSSFSEAYCIKFNIYNSST